MDGLPVDPRGIFAVTQIDHAPIADGEPSPLTTRLKQLYWQRHDEGWQSTSIDYDAED